MAHLERALNIAEFTDVNEMGFSFIQTEGYAIQGKCLTWLVNSTLNFNQIFAWYLTWNSLVTEVMNFLIILCSLLSTGSHNFNTQVLMAYFIHYLVNVIYERIRKIYGHFEVINQLDDDVCVITKDIVGIFILHLIGSSWQNNFSALSIQPEIPELLEWRPIGRKFVIFPKYESFSLKFRVESQNFRKFRYIPREIPENAVPFVTGNSQKCKREFFVPGMDSALCVHTYLIHT